jgi:hypothetical protein
LPARSTFCCWLLALSAASHQSSFKIPFSISCTKNIQHSNTRSDSGLLIARTLGSNPVHAQRPQH